MKDWRARIAYALHIAIHVALYACLFVFTLLGVEQMLSEADLRRSGYNACNPPMFFRMKMQDYPCSERQAEQFRRTH